LPTVNLGEYPIPFGMTAPAVGCYLAILLTGLLDHILHEW
jgi:hypothetical protein